MDEAFATSTIAFCTARLRAERCDRAVSSGGAERTALPHVRRPAQGVPRARAKPTAGGQKTDHRGRDLPLRERFMHPSGGGRGHTPTAAWLAAARQRQARRRNRTGNLLITN